MGKTTSEKAYMAKATAKGNEAKYAAESYVWKGLEKTGLSSKAQNELAKKLVPIVQSRIQNDLNKTATRGAIQVKREEINAKKAAVKKIVGGK